MHSQLVRQEELESKSLFSHTQEILVLLSDDEERIRNATLELINEIVLPKGTSLSTEACSLPVGLTKENKDFRKKTAFGIQVSTPHDLHMSAKAFSHPDDIIQFLQKDHFSLRKKTIVCISDINYREHHADSGNANKTVRTLTEHISEINNWDGEPIPVTAYSTCNGEFFDKVYGTQNNYAGRTVKPVDQMYTKVFVPDKNFLKQHLALWILWSINMSLHNPSSPKNVPPKKKERAPFNFSEHPTLDALIKRGREHRLKKNAEKKRA